MAVSSDVTISQDGAGGQGGGGAQLHPYLVALVRWCVWRLWRAATAATVLLRRLVAAPLPALTAPKTWKSRPASKEHLHPEPTVRCTLLHQPRPAAHTLDVIFVHGLYGSLANTWRQGEWRPKYSSYPEKVHLRRSSLIPTQRNCSCCDCTTDTQTQAYIEQNDLTNNDDFDEDKNNLFNYEDDFTNIDEIFYNKIKHILPIDETFTTEKFYNNTLLNHVEIVDNYEAQARFVSDLFKNCDSIIKESKKNNEIDSNGNSINKDGQKLTFNENKSAFKESILICDINDENSSKKSYMNKDIANRYNNNNYDSAKNCKSDNNKQNIDNTKTTNEADYDNCINTIKDEKDMCECREDNKIDEGDKIIEEGDKKIDARDNKIDGEGNEINCKCKNHMKQCDVGCGCLCDECYSSCWPRDWVKEDYPGARVISIDYTSDPHLWRPLWIKGTKRLRLHERAEQMTEQLLALGVGQKPVVWVGHSKGGLFIKQIYCEAYEAYLKTKEDGTNHGHEAKNKETDINHNSYETKCNIISSSTITADENDDDVIRNNNGILNTLANRDTGVDSDEQLSNSSTEDSDLKNEDVMQREQEPSIDKEGHPALSPRARAALWARSAGFMFYSVPHRGSPLAAIKTPVTARSVELLEISKDCTLVVSLQERWLRATEAAGAAAGAAGAGAPRAPLVRSLVETRRTLMSVLWLRIVSYDSADPGLGALCGVSVDHREICKPSSRRCLLYTELKGLIGAALAAAGSKETKHSHGNSLSDYNT